MNEEPQETYTYTVIEEAENAGDAKIKKTGLTAEFTLNDIDRDMKYLQRKKEELEGQMRIEDAKMKNIDDTNPEVGAMSEEMRQVIYIYQKAFSFCKVGKEKVEEIDNQIKEYRQELMAIVVQTGLGLSNDGEEKEAERTDGAGTSASANDQ
jgi:hypothetical protein